MSVSPLAGKAAPAELLIDPDRLAGEYYDRRPDVDDPDQLASFGTSGHRGTPRRGTFTETHILAITQAICDYRQRRATERSWRTSETGRASARCSAVGASPQPWASPPRTG